MDLREIPTTRLRGSTIGFFAPMNGGKTEGLIQELKRAQYYNLQPLAYNHAHNTRERDAIVIDGKEKYPATTIDSILTLRQDLEQKVQQLRIDYHTNEIARITSGNPYGTHPPRGIEQLNEIVIGIDEINLFCLSEKEAQDTVEFMDWCRGNNMLLLVAGLLYDFRHRPFGYVHSLLPYIDIKEEKKPACMAIRPNGKKCDDTAKHTQRVWSKEFAKQQDVEFLLELQPDFPYVNKDRQTFVTQYIAAPFFDKTVHIEETKGKKDIDYLPVCSRCAQLPFKEETFAVYNSLMNSHPPKLKDPRLESLIKQFLIEEAWVSQQGKKCVAQPYYHSILGGFAPR